MSIEKHNWWEKPENKETFNFPISVAENNGCWVATCNSETDNLLGDRLHTCAQGKTKQEAIMKMFLLIKMSHSYSEDCRLNYQRFVPFRKGDWKHSGGKWLVIFGIQLYFRYGQDMKGGVYIPFTKLNISLSSQWANYRKFKREQAAKLLLESKDETN